MGEFPYNVLVGFETNLSQDDIERMKIIYHSGGAVLNKWYIITVAHLFDGAKGQVR